MIVAVAVVAPLATADTVKILTSTKASTIAGADADDDLDAFYVGLGAVSSLMTGTVTAGDLFGVDVFIVMLPDDAFTAAEEAAISSFAVNGGTLLLMGDQGGFAPTEDGYLDGLLAGLGSAMSLDANSLDTSGLQNTGAGQIILQAGLTDDVSIVNYGNVSSISGVSPANELFLTSNLLSLWGGFEGIGNGRIILLGDTNLVSNLEDTVGNDNHVFFSNLVGIDTQNTSVKVLTSALAGTIANADADNDLNTFYLAAGITSSLWAGVVSDESLASAELLVVMLPDDAFSASELTALDDFLVAGGRILFIGEQDGFAVAENAHINAALAFVGSSMTVDLVSLDATGLQDTVQGQIKTHPYNPGVAVVNYGKTRTRSPGSQREAAWMENSSGRRISLRSGVPSRSSPAAEP